MLLSNQQKVRSNEQKVTTEAAAGGALLKKVFLNFLQNSQENTCIRVSSLWTTVSVTSNEQRVTNKEQ